METEIKTVFKQMDELGTQKIPFLFIINYAKTKGIVMPLESLPDEISYQINPKSDRQFSQKISFEKTPVSFDVYQQQFDKAVKMMALQDAAVVNLTCSTEIHTDLMLSELYDIAHARYKLFWKDHFICFSPEIFVKIRGNTISSFPMKGTIDGSSPDARQTLLTDEKEIREHTDVATMMGDDLQMVADNVSIKRFRYIEEIKTNDKTLLEVSSEIAGEIKDEYRFKIGSIFDRLLPGASICGFPRKAAMDIISNCESHNRNYYTGIFGIFDGQDVDSGVLIRFIEKTPDGLVYKSGGGITLQSECRREYNEMIDKIYVPIH